MGWRITPVVEEILKRGENLQGLTAEEAVTLLSLGLDSKEVYALMETAHRMSREQFGQGPLYPRTPYGVFHGRDKSLFPGENFRKS